jgi:glycosyltransferase involved in cell wall biosynthesis
LRGCADEEIVTDAAAKVPNIVEEKDGSTAARQAELAVVVCTVAAAPVRDAVDSVLGSARAAGRPVELVVVWQAGEAPPELGDGVRVLDVFPVGLSHARNVGLASTTAPLVAFVDDDEVVDPGWVAGVLAGFERPGRPDAVFGPVAPRDDRGLPYCTFEGGEHLLFHERSTPPWTVGTGGNMAFRREALEAAGGFDTRFGIGGPAQSAEELDAIMRLLRAGRTLAFSPELPAYHPTKTEQEHLASRWSYGFGMGALFRRHRSPLLAARYALTIVQTYAKGVRERDRRRRREVLRTFRSFVAGLSSRLHPASPALPRDRVPAELGPLLGDGAAEPLEATLGDHPHFRYALRDGLVLHVFGSGEDANAADPGRTVAQARGRGALWVVERS